ncbi:MAG TPA: hypothetical protein VGV90_19075 [Solirubrobacteraceae bacterium]|nr:hypothetical protein [Solirubrobacteraceae bacterium]
MRMLLKFQLDTEAANRAIDDGSMAEINEKMFAQMQPEAAYFAIEDGVRTGYVVFDLDDPSMIPVIAEPLFSGVNSKVALTPVMNTDDLMKGLQKADVGA